MKPPIYFRPMDDDDKVVFQQRTHYYPGSEFGGIVAYFVNANRRHVVMGMVGFDSWAPRTVMTHFWIRHPRCIESLWYEAVQYIKSTGRKALLGATPSDNERALKAIRHLGWDELYRIKDAWDDGVDLVISEYKIHGLLQRSSEVSHERREGRVQAAGNNQGLDVGQPVQRARSG